MNLSENQEADDHWSILSQILVRIITKVCIFLVCTCIPLYWPDMASQLWPWPLCGCCGSYYDATSLGYGILSVSCSDGFQRKWLPEPLLCGWSCIDGHLKKTFTVNNMWSENQMHPIWQESLPKDVCLWSKKNFRSMLKQPYSNNP